MLGRSTALAVIVLVACARSRPPASETTVVVQTDSVAVVFVDSSNNVLGSRVTGDLSGRWITGSDDEPAAREIRLQRDCRYTPAAWLLDQRGDSVYAMQAKESWARGVAEPPEPMPAMAMGRLRGHKLVLRDGANRWVLAYDDRSGHLRGTLNGRSFWALRQILEEPTERCIPVP